MFNIKNSLLTLMLSALVASTQVSAVVVSGQIANIDGDGDSNINDLSISLVTFEASAGERIDIDAITGFDGGNAFRSTLMLLVDDVDVAFKHSMSTTNSLSYDVQSSGVHTLAIGYALFSLEDALVGYEYQNTLPTGTGDWQLTFSDNAYNVEVVGATPVPLPASLPLLFAAIAGLGIIRRR